MEIRIQSVKFDADKKLLEFVEKKLSKIERFYDGITSVDVTMSLISDNQNKSVKVIVAIPGNTVVVERNGKSFEDAVNESADILKEKLTRIKEKKAE
ncbi:MAG: ribosome-associated translation inhibitor RaiA [Bacteroidales bacterium]|nr:ribosome-associated translation inhibitor RaiA [Candidatus Cryptobacteroides caccocaballi]